MPRFFVPLLLLYLGSSVVRGSAPSIAQLAGPYTTNAVVEQELPVQRYKKQAIQSVSLSGGWLAAIRSNDLHTSHVKTSIGLGVPLGSFETILGVTPSFRVDWIDAASGMDVPSQLFETGVSFFYRKPISERLSAMAIVTPSIRSDFTTSDQALRVFGLGLLNWEKVADTLTLSGGVVFLGRADLPVLPAVGLTWTPDVRTKLDLRFPQARYSHRLMKEGAKSETWGYCSAGIGGNTWAVTRQSGLTDELSLRDIRVLCGIEHVTDGGGGWFCEAGFAFARKIEYERTATEVSLSDGLLLNAGWNY